MADGFEDAARVETIRLRKPDGQPVGGNFFERVGGTETFDRLATAFYREVAKDDVLLEMYPESDLEPAKERLRMFLEQYWGGPSTYQEQRGHPRLRMRHASFKINPDARARWLSCMRTAVDELKLPPLSEAELWAYLDRAATAMLNSFD